MAETIPLWSKEIDQFDRFWRETQLQCLRVCDSHYCDSQNLDSDDVKFPPKTTRSRRTKETFDVIQRTLSNVLVESQMVCLLEGGVSEHTSQEVAAQCGVSTSERKGTAPRKSVRKSESKVEKETGPLCFG